MSRRRKSAFTPPSPKLIHRPVWSLREKQQSNIRKTIYKSKSLPENLELLTKKRHNNIAPDVNLLNNLRKGDNSISRTKSVSFQPEILLVTAVSEDDYKEVLRLLKRKDIDVNYRTASGQSVLHHAAFVGSINSLKLLLKKGADINILDNGGRSALDVAVRNGFFDCASELIQNGSKVEQLATGGNHW